MLACEVLGLRYECRRYTDNEMFRKTGNNEKHVALFAWQNRDGASTKLLIVDIYNKEILREKNDVCLCVIYRRRRV